MLEAVESKYDVYQRSNPVVETIDHSFVVLKLSIRDVCSFTVVDVDTKLGNLEFRSS